MRNWLVCVLAVSLASCPGCKGKKAKYAGVSSGALDAFSAPEQLGIGEDVYVSKAMDLEGKYLLYAIERDPKEGWGFLHGKQLMSYNMELKIKLPLGPLGRSVLYGFVYVDEKPMLAVIKTVDTNGDGDVDEEDANQLVVMAPDGLDEEPVSMAGHHVVGFWPDPRGGRLYFATTDYWEGKKVEPGKEPKGDPVLVVHGVDLASKEISELGECRAFLGVSPDGLQTACVRPKGVDPSGSSVTVEIATHDGKTAATSATLPTTIDQRILPMGKGMLAYTRFEATSTGARRVLYLHPAQGNDVQVTSGSVDSEIVSSLGDGGVLFSSRALYTVDDQTAFFALSGDGKKVHELARVKGAQKLEMPGISGDGRYLAWFEFPEESFDASPKARVMMSKASGKAKTLTVAEMAGQDIAGLGETMVEKLRAALGQGTPVKLEEITVSVPGKRAVLPMKASAEVTDAALMQAMTSVRDKVGPVVAIQGYDAVFPMEGHPDAVGVMKWHEEFKRHLGYMVAYGHWVPLMEEYDLIVEDLMFRKLPGCADPRMVQLHATGWVVAMRDIGAKKLELVCRATPLDPNMKVREGEQAFDAVAPGGDALSFDIVADKVDPRYSHRSRFDLLVFADGEQVPFYDASWTEATKAWIEVLRALPGHALTTGKIVPYAMGDESIHALAKWFPSTVVRQDQHLDVHLSFGDGAPADDKKEEWDALADKLMVHFTPYLEQYDPENVLRLRVTLYHGPLEMTSAWHMTPEERFTLGCENGDAESCYQLALIYQAQGKKTIAEMAIFEACDMGSEAACEAMNAGAPVEGGAAAPDAKKATEGVPEPGELEKKSALPPELAGPAPLAPTLSKSEIQAAIKVNITKIQSCFEKATVDHGNVSVRITIDGKGKVTDAGIKTSSAGSDEVSSCVLVQVKMIAFPATPDGNPFTFTYPFTFVK